jgi:hypothetical protein
VETTPDDDIDDENFPTPTPKARKARVKKLDINFDDDLESSLKKLTYRKRDDRDN